MTEVLKFVEESLKLEIRADNVLCLRILWRDVKCNVRCDVTAIQIKSNQVIKCTKLFWSVLCFFVFLNFQNICLKNISLRVSVCSVYVRAFPVTSKGNNPIFNFDQSYDLNFKTLLIYFKTFNVLFKITKLFFRKLAIHLKRFKYFETNYNCNLSW